MSKNDGGPAFPVDLCEEGGPSDIPQAIRSAGMSLRDWFAGQVLAALCVEQEWISKTEKAGKNPVDLMVRTAYGLADAMIAERSKP